MLSRNVPIRIITRVALQSRVVFFDQGYSQRKDLVVCTPDKRMRNYVTVIANTEFAIVRVVPDSILRRDIDDRR